jgi:hypothetical protein
MVALPRFAPEGVVRRCTEILRAPPDFLRTVAPESASTTMRATLVSFFESGGRPVTDGPDTGEERRYCEAGKNGNISDKNLTK